DVDGQCAGVHPRDADHAVLGEGLLQVALRAPVGRADRRVPDDETGRPDALALHVLRVDSGVAVVRGGEHGDLPVVAGVGERLLVAGHAGAEHRLADGLTDRSVGVALEDTAVLEHQDRGGRGVHAPAPHTRPSRAVTRPRSMVRWIPPVSSRPCHGLLRESDLERAASTTTLRSGSTRVRLAGAPTVSPCPWSVSRAMRAGSVDMVRATSAQLIRPSATMTVLTTESAVSRPSMPKAASM